MLGLQFSVVLPQFLRLEPREGRRGKRTEDRVLFPKPAPNPEGRRHGKKETAPPDWEVAGLRSRGLTYEACPECKAGRPPPESESFLRNLNRIQVCFQSKRRSHITCSGPHWLPLRGRWAAGLFQGWGGRGASITGSSSRVTRRSCPPSQ